MNRAHYSAQDTAPPSALHILMVAPEPFFEPRGTPFSEYHRIRALLDLGHTVDLVTYPFGADVDLPGLRVFRCLRPPLVRQIRIGPSWAKIPLDLTLTITAIRRVLSTRYHAIHSHEEGGAIGVVLSRLLGIPHLYDMHSSLPQQLANFDFSRSRALAAFFRWIERVVIRRSQVTIVICPHLEDVVRRIDRDAVTVLIENAPGSGDMSTPGAGERLRRELGLPLNVPIVLYTGTFEAYQGLDLLFAAAGHVIRRRPDVRFVMVGGRPDQIARFQQESAREGIAPAFVFAGQRPAEEIPDFLAAADVLVSPRSTGWNTPLKIYQYLRSGRPIVATRLLTHTQVLDDDVAVLTGATPEEFAAGIVSLINDPDRARQIGARARALAETKYSYETYLAQTRLACGHLMSRSSPQIARGMA